MTTGDMLYLAMVIGMFSLFAGVLAYETWQQSRPRTRMTAAREDHGDMHDSIHA